MVATVLTACGIETEVYADSFATAYVATVLTACGIETLERSSDSNSSFVATVLTACGIETGNISNIETGSGLQQYLPLAVLKR